jgi:hypothetical protein
MEQRSSGWGLDPHLPGLRAKIIASGCDERGESLLQLELVLLDLLKIGGLAQRTYHFDAGVSSGD